MGFLAGPLAWLALAGWLATAGTYGVMWISKERAKVAAYELGHRDGAAAVNSAGVKGAEETAKARIEAEAETPPVPADKAALIELCNRSASCRERGQLK